MAEVIKSFSGEYAFLSNFAACTIYYEDILYPSTEHAFQAAKSLDVFERQMVANAATPGLAKKLGRTITLRDDWEDVKVGIMRELLTLKFSQGMARALLFSTGDLPLVESNHWHDQIWGSCTCVQHRDIDGQNLLGTLLMELRSNLKRR
jgi:ribA/ribD-fused uncharacterized protein